MGERPKRIQRKRTKGFRLPPNTVCVDRTSRYGNPFTVRRVVERWVSPITGMAHRAVHWEVTDTRPGRTFGDHYIRNTEADAREKAVEWFRWDTLRRISAADLERIRNADFVACFCDPDDGMACHGDVLIEAAFQAGEVQG